MTTTESLLLVIDNDEPLYTRCMSRAIKSGSPFRLADELKDMFEFLLDDLNLRPVSSIQPSLRKSADLLVRQLVSHALGDVDWQEIADHYLTKVAENAT